jgi:hypothetical protein
MRTKYHYLLLLLIILHATIVFAQQKKSVWIHAIGGVNSSWIANQNAYGNPEFEYATTFKLSAGGGFTYYFNDKFGISAQGFTTGGGQNYAGNQRGGRALREVQFQFIEIPVLLHWRLANKSDMMWFTMGPDLLLLQSANQTYSRKGGKPLQNPDGMKEGDVLERYNTTDVALNLGLNKMIKLNYKGSFLLLLTFNTAFGAIDLNKEGWKTENLHGVYRMSNNYYFGIKAGLMQKIGQFGGGRW